jgi:histone-lysine N-methyltransferase SETD1
MSRASGASFAQFFPSAPRAAKDKAKEREKVKTHILGSPSKRPLADNQSAQSTFRVENVDFPRFGGESNTPIIDSAPPPAEDNESVQGDLLNGVGSASSHSSTISSVFSAPAQQPNMSNFGSTRNVSSLTPLTTSDSSPSRITSPYQYKTDAQATNSIGFAINRSLPQNDVAQAQPETADQKPQEPRVYVRDPSRGIKGTKCTYDPLLDRKLSSNEKKKAKPIYKEFGLVRTHNIICWGASSYCENVG